MSAPHEWIEEVSRDQLQAVNAGIARWVRMTGTEDERKAFDFIASTLEGYGLAITLHEPTCLVSNPVSARLQAGGQDFHCITTSFSTSTPETGVAGQLVYAGGGSPSELGAAEAAGKIALTEGLASPQKARAATQAGVRALICISGEHLHEMTVSPVWGSPTPETLDMLPQVPVISVDSATGEQLKALIDGAEARVRVTTVVDTRWRKIPVLLADLDVEGRDYVMFSGHVDSWHYGAMDNGSANATMIEVARILANHRDELRRGVRFAFWSGHSQARYAGSTWFADAYWFDLRDRCVAHVNVDSTGGKGATDLTTANTMAETYGFARDVIRRQTGQELIYQRFGRAGDQSFWGIGLPAIFMSVSHQGEASDVTADLVRLTGGTAARSGGLGWWWHTTEDTLDKIDPELHDRDTRIYVEVVGRLATDAVLPYDLTGPIHEMLTELEALEGVWGAAGELSADDAPGFEALRAELQAARDAAAALNVRIADGVDDGDAEEINAALLSAARYLMPVNYTAAGEFDHDPALGARTLPSLHPGKALAAMNDDELWASLHKVRRSANGVRYHVRLARRALEAVSG
ncbi:MAG TPA: M28 family peptidase [Thermomicrobiales bacterium]|nr:M28 family peptidase [Thermomicrobiales bacterium]